VGARVRGVVVPEVDVGAGLSDAGAGMGSSVGDGGVDVGREGVLTGVSAAAAVGAAVLGRGKASKSSS
jgi:hypothetical protein